MNAFKMLGRVMVVSALAAAVWMIGCYSMGDALLDEYEKEVGTSSDSSKTNDTTTTGNETVEVVSLGGKTWMKKNLNIETADSWCYGEGGQVMVFNNEGKEEYITISNSEISANCAKYGRLYTWNAAKSACPLAGSGWRLPTRAEWDSLARAVGGIKDYSSESDVHDWGYAGKYLKSQTGWDYDGNGTDDYGFSALPGGIRNSSGGFYYAGYNGYWWTAEEYVSEEVSEYAYRRRMIFTEDYLGEGSNSKGNAFSVRCVKD